MKSGALFLVAFCLTAPTASSEAPSADQVKPLSHPETLMLTNAMYGIPLGATLEEVVKWSEQQDMQVVNDTRASVTARIKVHESLIDELKAKIREGQYYYGDLELELRKLLGKLSRSERLDPVDSRLDVTRA